MSIAPAEFTGKARAWRAAATAGDVAATNAAHRIGAGLCARLAHNQTPSSGAFDRIVTLWRNQIPPNGRLSIETKATRHNLWIDETRVIPAPFRFNDWTEGETETSMAIVRTVLTATPAGIRFTPSVIASVPLHALARRFQRGWNNADEAIRADLLALAALTDDTLSTPGDHTVPTADGGKWLGIATEVKDRGEFIRILVVRTFYNADMSVRSDNDAIGAVPHER